MDLLMIVSCFLIVIIAMAISVNASLLSRVFGFGSKTLVGYQVYTRDKSFFFSPSGERVCEATPFVGPRTPETGVLEVNFVGKRISCNIKEELEGGEVIAQEVLICLKNNSENNSRIILLKKEKRLLFSSWIVSSKGVSSPLKNSPRT